MPENDIEKRKEAVKESIKAKLNNRNYLIFLAILAVGIIIRLYYYAIAKNQPHWWDSMAYGSIAKNMIYHLWDNNGFLVREIVARPPLFPLIWSILIRINFSEVATLFLLEIIPSALCIWLIYLIAKELYNERVALVSALIMSVSWIVMFYSLRIMTDVPALCLSLASIYFFIRSYEDFNKKYFALSIFFVAIAILFRYFYGIIGLAYIIFIIFVHRGSFLKKKNFWIGGLIGAIPVILFALFNLIKSGSLLPATGFYASSAASKDYFGWYAIKFIPYILSASQGSLFKLVFSVFTIFFIIGLVLIVFEGLLGFDKIRQNKKIKSHLLMILLLVLPFIFFIFIVKDAEDRYLFLNFAPILVLAGVGLAFCYDYVKKYSKPIAIIALIAILLFGAYNQIHFGDALIKQKMTSYAQMRDAFLWIHDNTPTNSVILASAADPYIIYYSERQVAIWNDTDIDINKVKADYLVIHAFENQNPNVIAYVNNRTTLFTPIHVVFFDAAQTQPAVIVYKINK